MNRSKGVAVGIAVLGLLGSVYPTVIRADDMILDTEPNNVKGSTVQLPYRSPANDGNQWMIYNQGFLQMQGNQPVFSQAGMLQINNNQPSVNGQTAKLDERTKEVILKFNIQQTSNIQVTRRILFEENSPVVRIVDTFDNNTAKEVSLNLSIQSFTNYGVNGGQIIKDSKKGDKSLAWAVDTGCGKSALSIFAGKGTKYAPKIQWQQGNNMAQSAYTLKIPAKGMVALAHWHGTFDSSDESEKWFADFKEGKALRDLPVEIRKALVNVASVGGFVGDRELLRGDKADIIELRGGDQLRGTIKLPQVTMNSTFGEVSIPIDKIAGILSVGEFRPRQLLVTQEGEIFGGVIKDSTVPIELGTGQVTNVPLSQLSRVGFRKHENEPEEWKFNKPMLILRGGERFVIQPPAEPIEFLTRYGMIKLKPEQVATILLQSEESAGVHDLYLSDGSHLSGLLSQTNWSYKLVSNASQAPINFQAASIARVQMQMLPEDIGSGMPTLAMNNGDLLSARLSGEMKLETSFDTINVKAAEVRSLIRNEQTGDVQVVLFDQSAFRGSLQVQSFKVTTASGVELTIPVAAVRDYQNPAPLPSESLVSKVTESIKKLDNDDWKMRDAAEAELVAMGPSITSALKESVNSASPEVQQRLRSVIGKLEKDAPKLPSRLLTPSPIE